MSKTFLKIEGRKPPRRGIEPRSSTRQALILTIKLSRKPMLEEKLYIALLNLF